MRDQRVATLPTNTLAVQTIGGLLLTGAHGSNTTKPSAFGHLVAGLTYVDARGEVQHLEGEEARSWTGSVGIYGVVTEVGLHAVREVRCIAWCRSATPCHGLSEVPSGSQSPASNPFKSLQLSQCSHPNAGCLQGT